MVRGLSDYDRVMRENLSTVSQNSLEEFFSVVRSNLKPDCHPAAEILSKRTVTEFFANIRPRLKKIQEEGGYINPWAVSGLGRNEVRTTYALASLWRYEFAGAVSRRFLALWLEAAIPAMSADEWCTILFNGYNVATEINPLGEAGDRVDIIIETSSHIIGVEVKIDAPQGYMQLERYQNAVTSLGRSTKRGSFIVFLSNRPARQKGVYNAHWRSIATAAKCAADNANTLQAELIKRFGDHVHKNLT